jgi:hypothetical protein
MNKVGGRPGLLMVMILICSSMSVAWLAALFPEYSLPEAGTMLLLGTVLICISMWARKMLSSPDPSYRVSRLDVLPAEAWPGNQSGDSEKAQEVLHAGASRF